MKLQKIIDREEVELDSKKLNQLNNIHNVHKEIKDCFQNNYDEMMKEFLYQWNLRRNESISADEYYAVVAYNKWLKENC